MTRRNQTLILLLCWPILLLAQPKSVTHESTAAFFDQAWQSDLSANGRIPGISLAVVKDGEIILARGYGTRDIDTGEPVLADSTLVRIGSVSKLFSALTALSLVEDGKMTLDADINQYLDAIDVAATYPDPVTVRTLLSHLSGFDSSISGFGAWSNDDLDVPDEVYNRHLVRLRPAGLVHAYDNTGLGLLGHTSGKVNGSSFEEAVRQHVTEPWKLNNTTMGIPDASMAALGACHSYNAEGEVIKCRHKLMRHGLQAAGDIASTATDMARFMIALLNGGELDGARVTSQSLHQQFTDMNMNRIHPALTGMGFLLFESIFSGHSAIGHTGGQDGFTTVMYLFPEFNTGIFMSSFIYPGIPQHTNLETYINMAKIAPAGPELDAYSKMNDAVTAFASEFFGSRQQKTDENKLARRSDIPALSIIEGNYVNTYNNPVDLLSRMFTSLGVIQVKVREDVVTINGKGPYKLVAPGELAMPGEEERYAFIQNRDAIILNSSSGMAAAPNIKVPWHYTGKLTVLPLLGTVILGLLGAIYAIFRKQHPAAQRIARLAFVSCILLTTGLLLDFQYFLQEFFVNGGGIFMLFWRCLINLSWLLAAYTIWSAIQNRAGLLKFSSTGTIIESIYLLTLLLGLLSIVVLVPYWGLLLNFTH